MNEIELDLNLDDATGMYRVSVTCGARSCWVFVRRTTELSPGMLEIVRSALAETLATTWGVGNVGIEINADARAAATHTADGRCLAVVAFLMPRPNIGGYVINMGASQRKATQKIPDGDVLTCMNEGAAKALSTGQWDYALRGLQVRLDPRHSLITRIEKTP